MSSQTLVALALVGVALVSEQKPSRTIEFKSDIPGSELRLTVTGLSGQHLVSGSSLQLKNGTFIVTSPARIVIPDSGALAITVQAELEGPPYHAIIPPASPTGSRFEAWGRRLMLRRAAGSQRLEMLGMDRGQTSRP
jgi:hypothetical protein